MVWGYLVTVEVHAARVLLRAGFGAFVVLPHLNSCNDVTLRLFLSSMVYLLLWWLCQLNRQYYSKLIFPHG